MSGKFMSVKRYIIPTITMVIIASQLCGCAAASQSELLQMINRGEQIEIEVAVPLNEEQGTEQSILWEQLASLTTNPTLRSAWDDTLLITKTDTGKNGVLYVNTSGENDNNNTLAVALHNRAFLQYLESVDTLETLAEAAMSQYVDIEPEETMKAVYMGINGYFNLLPDADVNYSNPDSTLTRAEFMSMVMRAETPVSEIKADSAFAAAVGNNDLNIYSQEVAEDNYLDLASKSLNNMTFNGTITRAEAIYLLMNHYFPEELANVNISNTTLSDVKDGGDIAAAQKFIEKGNAKDYWKSYELTYAISNPDDGVPTSLYKALVLAEQKGIISSETSWDEGITKAEAIELLVSTLKVDTSIEVFNFKQGTIDGYEVTETEKETTVASGSMGEMAPPEVQSEDFLIEDMEPTTMYVIDSVMAKEGPHESDFEDSNYLWKDEVISVIGVVKSYKGEACTWYRLNTGEFISSDFLSTEQPAAEQPTTQTQPTQPQTKEESPLSGMTDQEIQDIFNEVAGSSEPNTGSTTADGRPKAEGVHDDDGVHYNGGTEAW